MPLYDNISNSSGIPSSTPSLETNTSRTVKFFILLALQWGAICCSLCLFFQFITKAALRRALYNHTIVALIIVSFFQIVSDLPMTLEYLRIGQAPSTTFCLMWNFFALSNYAVGVWIMTWASLERHFLIFHDHLMTTTRGMILFHHIPLWSSLIIPWIYYLILIFFYPCTNNFHQWSLFCGWCCYVHNDLLVLFNWLAFGVIPTCSITVLSLWLIVRVVKQKRRAQQRIRWRQYRHMVIQLLTVSCLYIFFDAPTIIIGLIRLAWPTFAMDVQTLYLYYLVYLLPLLVPFVCLSTLRELKGKKHPIVSPWILLTRTRAVRRQENVLPVIVEV